MLIKDATGPILIWLEWPARKKQTCKQKLMGTESSCRSGLTASTEVTIFKAMKITQAHVPHCPPPTAVKVLSMRSECIQNTPLLARWKVSYKLEQCWGVTATLTSQETSSFYTALHAMLAMYWMSLSAHSSNLVAQPKPGEKRNRSCQNRHQYESVS